MKTVVVYIFLAAGLLLGACKKTRTCECKNANGTYTAGEIEATKSKAKKQCEALSTSATECYLK